MSLLWNLSIYIYIYIYHTLCRKLLPALICEFLRHSLIQELFDTNCHTSLMETARTETTCGPTFSMTGAIGATPWQNRFHPSMPLFVLPLQPTDSGSHSSHGPTSPMATSMSMSARVTSVQTHPAKHMVCQTRVHAAAIQTGHDMPAGLASLTIQLDPLSGLQLCISVDFVSYIIPFLYTHFPLHVHSHHGLSKIIHTPKLYTHPQYSLLISYVFAQARPTMFYIHQYINPSSSEILYHIRGPSGKDLLLL